jgi:MFS family permease
VCALRVQRDGQRAGSTPLSALLFLQAMAQGMWFVPLSPVLEAHGLGALRPYAFAAFSLAAFISPLVFGAMADRHMAPTRVLRWLATCAGVTMALAAWGIQQRWGAAPVLGLIQLHALFSVPTWSIASAVVFAQLSNSSQQFGPIRAMATLGWMCGCWVVSALGADSSTLAMYAGAIMWLGLACFTLTLPAVEPPPSSGKLTLRERLGLDALGLLRHGDHRVVFVTAALFCIPMAAFYPFTPPHLRELGFERSSAWMTLGQVTEVIVLVGLARALTNWRLKWVFAAGLGFAVLRFALCAVNEPGWLLAGVALHGPGYALFFVTAQIYVNERMDPAWRARAQALFSLVTGGVGSLLGYLSTGWWFGVNASASVTNWTLFWSGLSGAVAVVLAYFILAYHGRRAGKLTRATEGATTPT